MYGTRVLVALALVVVASAFPLHASCRVTWTFAQDSCADVQNALVGAFKTLSTSNCGSGEKCLYMLSSASNGTIAGTHTTPAKHYVDDITFTLSGEQPCIVSGYSTSETWYAVLDYGTNYCNLHNLGVETGFSYSEATSDSICTQYSSANCDKY